MRNSYLFIEIFEERNRELASLMKECGFKTDEDLMNAMFAVFKWAIKSKLKSFKDGFSLVDLRAMPVISALAKSPKRLMKDSMNFPHKSGRQGGGFTKIDSIKIDRFVEMLKEYGLDGDQIEYLWTSKPRNLDESSLRTAMDLLVPLMIETKKYPNRFKLNPIHKE